MKKLLLSLSALLFSATIFSQNIVNPSFESWTGYVSSGGPGEFPDGWTTSDSITMSNSGGPSAFKGTDPYDGSFALHLKSTQILFGGVIQIKGAALATNGKVELVGTSFVYSGGSPDTARSRFFSGYYKYSPVGGSDLAEVSVVLYHFNGASRDTIAAGLADFGAAAAYTQMVIPMVYRDYVTQPDSCFILLKSSNGEINSASVGIGSEFVVDSLSFGGFVGVDEISSQLKDLKVYPSPADNILTIDAELKTPLRLSYEIFDGSARMVRSAKMISAKETIDVSSLAAGQYTLQLTGNEKTPLMSKHFSINR